MESDPLLLPANPNAVVFSAPASLVFGHRTWGQVLELAQGPLLTLHRASGLPCVAGFGWRVGLDRKNRRTLRVAMYFVVDGPLAAEHLDQLEQATSHNPVRWGSSQVERLPGNGLPVLVAHDGGCSLLVENGSGGGAVRGLRYDGSALHTVSIALTEEAIASREVLDLPPVAGRLPDYNDADRELECMRLAFAHTFAQRIMEADGVVHDGEARFMAEVFRPTFLVRLGIGEPHERTPWFERSIRELPERLGYHDKLALIGLFFSACYSDGTLDAREMRVLKDASDALGVERERVVQYLQRFW